MSIQSEARFWDRYIEFLTKFQIKAAHRPWYVRHVERFIAKTKGVMLGEHDAKSVAAYLEGLGRLDTVKTWQFTQHIEALEILYNELLAAPWARSFAWQYWKNAALSLDSNHPTLAREANPVELTFTETNTSPLSAVTLDHTSVVNELRVAIRAKNYSIRTERTYIEWVLRFFRILMGGHFKNSTNFKLKNF